MFSIQPSKKKMATKKLNINQDRSVVITKAGLPPPDPSKKVTSRNYNPDMSRASDSISRVGGVSSYSAPVRVMQRTKPKNRLNVGSTQAVSRYSARKVSTPSSVSPKVSQSSQTSALPPPPPSPVKKVKNVETVEDIQKIIDESVTTLSLKDDENEEE